MDEQTDYGYVTENHDVKSRAFGTLIGVPYGTQVRNLAGPQGPHWVVDSIERLELDPDGIDHHDAVHYGIAIPADRVRPWVRDSNHGAYAVDVSCLRCAARIRLADAWIDKAGPAFKAYYCAACARNHGPVVPLKRPGGHTARAVYPMGDPFPSHSVCTLAGRRYGPAASGRGASVRGSRPTQTLAELVGGGLA